jgi:hypothetical protein
MKYTIVTDDDIEALRILKSLDMASALWDIQHNLRKRCEWAIEGIGADEFLDKIFDELNDILIEHDIDSDNLIE